MKKLQYEIYRFTHDLSDHLSPSETIRVKVRPPKVTVSSDTVTIVVNHFTNPATSHHEAALNQVLYQEDVDEYNDMVNKEIDQVILNKLITQFNKTIGTAITLVDYAFVDDDFTDMHYTITGPDRDLLLYEAWFDGEVMLDIDDPDPKELADFKAMTDEELIKIYNDYFGDDIETRWENLK